jgi:glycosyltransferase involved in cell wall biosynthesis
MKVLHVLRQLNPGGIECWLERLIEAWPESSRPEFHFALEESAFGSLAPKFEALGVRLHHCPPPRQASSARAFFCLLDNAGPFDAIHCHNHHAAAFHLTLAALRGIRVRIAHSHADFRTHPRRNSANRRLYELVATLLLNAVATTKLAVSQGAACDLFGVNSAGVTFLPCGADFERLLTVSRKSDAASFTLVHVGRMVPEKNHEFLFQLFRLLYQNEPNARLRLIGDGPLRSGLEARASELGLSSAIEFCGNQPNIEEFLATGDAFVFPSHSEGLGLAAIEAQAAGLPVLLAANLPAELNLLPQVCRRLALDLPLSHWVNALLEMRHTSQIPAPQRRSLLAGAACSLPANIAALREIYAG